MRKIARLGTVLVGLMLIAPQQGVSADPNPPVESFTYTSNLEPLGAAPRTPPSGSFNSDLAFWGDLAVQGAYDGFHLIDISNPEDPQTLNDYRECSGTSTSNQGDVIIWENLLVRSWNSPAPAQSPPVVGEFAQCDGEDVPQGFEGLHIFDISDPQDPDLVGSVDLECGSHTATGVPDPANDRLIVYNSGSSTTCPGIDVVEIPLSDPETPILHGRANAGRSCHDTAVILGDAMLAACAGGNGYTLFSIGGLGGGSLEAPQDLYSKFISGVTIGHAVSFSWDASTLIFGHEPAGGSAAECEATDDEVKKTMFFFEASTGQLLGKWVLPRPQTAQENCTIHNFNVVPTADRNIVVSGSYQSGISVVDFTNPAQPHEIAYADPAPLDPETDGGDWSSYWYDGTIYESDMLRGLITWRLNDSAVAGAQTLGHLNPQTQESTFAFTGEVVTEKCKGKAVTLFGTLDADTILGTTGADVIHAEGGNDRVAAAKGEDIVCGGRGNDRLRGQGGSDLLVGQAGKDKLIGGRGSDRCAGGPRRDRARGCEAGKV